MSMPHGLKQVADSEDFQIVGYGGGRQPWEKRERDLVKELE
jgi:hypothetical protein